MFTSVCALHAHAVFETVLLRLFRALLIIYPTPDVVADQTMLHRKLTGDVEVAVLIYNGTFHEFTIPKFFHIVMGTSIRLPAISALASIEKMRLKFFRAVRRLYPTPGFVAIQTLLPGAPIVAVYMVVRIFGDIFFAQWHTLFFHVCMGTGIFLATFIAHALYICMRLKFFRALRF